VPFVLTKGTNDQDTTEFAYVAYAYAYVLVKTSLKWEGGVTPKSS